MSDSSTSRESIVKFSGGTVFVTLTAPVTGQQYDDLVSLVAPIVHQTLVPKINKLPETGTPTPAARLTKSYRTHDGGELVIKVKVISDRNVDFQRLTAVLEHSFAETHVLVDIVDKPETAQMAAGGSMLDSLIDALGSFLLTDGLSEDFLGSPFGGGLGDMNSAGFGSLLGSLFENNDLTPPSVRDLIGDPTAGDRSGFTRARRDYSGPSFY